MKRKQFLKEFLEALGAVEIIYSSETSSQIVGKVIYDLNDDEETQSFIWRIKEDCAPNEEIIQLVKLINNQNLLDIDQINISKEKLCQIYNDSYNSELKLHEFVLILEKLEDVKVTMIDDGEETDFFFIHE